MIIGYSSISHQHRLQITGIKPVELLLLIRILASIQKLKQGLRCFSFCFTPEGSEFGAQADEVCPSVGRQGAAGYPPARRVKYRSLPRLLMPVSQLVFGDRQLAARSVTVWPGCVHSGIRRNGHRVVRIGICFTHMAHLRGDGEVFIPVGQSGTAEYEQAHSPPVYSSGWFPPAGWLLLFLAITLKLPYQCIIVREYEIKI